MGRPNVGASWKSDLRVGNVIVDTSVVTAPGFDNALILLFSEVRRIAPVAAPLSIGPEITDSLADQARVFQENLNGLGLITNRGDATDSTPHPAVLLRETVRLRLSGPVIVFTNDSERIHDLLLIREHESYLRDAGPIHVVRWNAQTGFTMSEPSASSDTARFMSWRNAITQHDAEVLIDTNALMHIGAERALMSVSQAFPEAKAMIGPFSAVKELKSLASKNKDDVSRALQLAEDLRNQGRLVWKGASDDPRFLDPLVIRKAIEYSAVSPTIVITNDRKLQRDLLGINSMVSWRYRPVSVIRFTRNGSILDVRGPGSSQAKNAIPLARATTQRFTYRLSPRAAPSQPVVGGRMPNPGEVVELGSGGSLQLGEQIGAGGEGVVFASHDNEHAVKIYEPRLLTVERQEKVRLLAAFPTPSGNTAWPAEEVLDRDGSLIGFVMKRMVGRTIQVDVFKPKVLQGRHPEWTRATLVGIAREIAGLVSQLHEMRVIVGDLNPRNVLVDDGANVSLVDIDSVQVQDLPCPVGMNNFTPPKRRGQNFQDFLRTVEDDEFALAVVIFMTLMPGKSPYARQGGGDLVSNMRAAKFPYRFDNEMGEPPPGLWPFIWSHFPYEVKEAFANVFKQDDRLTAPEWVRILTRYEGLIARGRASDEVLPRKFKSVKGGGPPLELLTCDECGGYFRGMSGDPRVSFHGRKMCPDCRVEERNCRRCNSQFTARTKPPRPQYCMNCESARRDFSCHDCGVQTATFPEDLREFQDMIFCKSCFKNKGAVMTCAACRRSFVWTYSDQKFYAERGFVPPKMCKLCRARR